MNTYEQTIKTLEWETVLEHLSGHSTCEIGKQKCLNTAILEDKNKIIQELSLVSEGKRLIDSYMSPPLSGIRNIYEFISIAAAGSILQCEELIDIANTLGASRRLKAFFERVKEEAPGLFSISMGMYQDKEFEEEIIGIFDEAGKMLESASYELKRLYLSLKDQTINLKNKLNSMINSVSFSAYLQESVFTIRSDRFVVPVKAEHKSHVQGIVHDISASGATIFIEPRAIVELNNNIKETELKIEAEIRRILEEMTSRVKNIASELRYTSDILAEIDCIFAKSKYSISIKGTEPEINDSRNVSLKNARHPILIKVVENVVPNDIEIGKNYSIMIITGPNTGGKTVALKTLGICTLMAKAGMHVPADAASIYPFRNIFADIGDEQSIIQSLSTFSSHMNNIINILNSANDETLILLDELGAGTDPMEGTALAEAILDYISQKSSRAVITTHFSELKALAYTREGFCNASAEFDTETLSPLYKLITGVPGMSNAIYIAQKLGLQKDIADKAREIYLNRKDPTEKVIEGLEQVQHNLAKNVKIAQESRETAETLERMYNEELAKINAEKKKIIGVYKKKFDSEFSKAKGEIRQILEESRRSKNEKILRRSMSRIGEAESTLKNFTNLEKDYLEPEYLPIDWGKARVGDTVFIKKLEQEAILASLPDKNNSVQVEMGFLKSSVKINELAKSLKALKTTKVTKVTGKQKNDFSSSGSFSSVSKCMRTAYNLSNTLDLRGFSAEDAIDKVEFYLDEASLANLSPIYLIHGHGTGVLRKAVREYLTSSPYVSKFHAAVQAEGGDGVTVAELK